jgi:pimeloyl-ACP methyl ester carboxylesterase
VIRKFLAGVAGGACLTVIANRLLAGRAGTPGPPLGRATDLYRWRGFDTAYTEAGDPDAPDLVLVHGINAAGSSAEFERVVDDLAEEYHVLAPDLPGFGLSDRPPLLYSPSLYETFLAEFLRDRSEEPTVVGSGLSGAYLANAVAGAEAGETDIDVARLVLVCPTAETVPGRRRWLRSLLRAPVVGEALFNLLVSRRSIRYFEADHGLYDTGLIDDAYVDYRWELTHQDGARFAPASFVSGFLDPEMDLGATLSGLETPITVVWGSEGDMLGVDRGRELAGTADARFVVFDEAILLPHYEHPTEFVAVVRGEDPVEAVAESD